jgi:hypothetical protein
MIKVVALLTRKHGLSDEAFRDYYETRHAPLILSCTKHLFSYERNYVNLRDSIFAPGAPALDFDVITEFLFPDVETYQTALADFNNAETAAKIASDEENVFDRSKTRFFLVDNKASVR